MAIQKFTVSRDENICHAWPDIVLTRSGKLICVFSECVGHLDRSLERLMICESTDRGRSWTQKKPLTEKGEKTNFFNCPRISRLDDDSLVIICDKVQGILGRPETQTNEQYVWFGDAEGESWSEPVVLPFKGIVPDKFKRISNHRIIVSAHTKNEHSGKLEQYLWYSDDNGKSWSDRVTVASDPNYNLCEASIIEVSENTLVALLRENSYCGYDIKKTISFDGGESWSAVYPTPLVAGHRPTAGYLKDGRVFVTYRFIPRGTSLGLFCSILNKEELLKTDADVYVRTMQLDHDRNPNPDGGYSGWVQFDDGEIYVVNYIKDDAQKSYIRGYSLYPEDMII